MLTKTEYARTPNESKASYGAGCKKIMKYKSQNVVCQNCKVSFTIDPEDFNFYEKIKVPPPTFCPLCRAQRRFAFRNERKLFKVKDHFTGEDIFSTYPAESGRKIITREEWFGDNWDLMEYGASYDFSKDCVDNSHINHSERCYESFWLENCYQCYFTTRSMESRNLYFCRGCVGCSDCFGCTNLRSTSYCIFNQNYSKEEYYEKIKSMQLDTFSENKKAREKARAFWDTQPVKYHQGLKNLNSTGSYVTNCKNVNDSYLVRESENMRYCQYLQVPKNKDNYDVTNWGEYIELCYETIECGENSYNNKFSRNCWPSCKNNEYCVHLFSSLDCFGCVGLKKKQYCILNKQYTKEEYEKMVEKIKKNMDEMPYADAQGLVYKYGEFFPIELSPFGYNNSLAVQHFPMTQEEAQDKKYPWIEVGRGEYNITKKARELPDSINEVSDQILKEVIECENCKNAYRILENELIFYAKKNCRFHECAMNADMSAE